jgi:hypothetical protein
MTAFRVAEETADLEPVMAALIAMLKKSPAPQMKYAEIGVARRSVKLAMRSGRAFICNGFFIMVDVGSDWYTSKCYLIEQIIVRVYPSEHKVATAIAALDEIARRFGADAIAVGDTQIGYMTPLYHAAGYTTLGTQLFKERVHGFHSQDHGSPGAD